MRIFIEVLVQFLSQKYDETIGVLIDWLGWFWFGFFGLWTVFMGLFCIWLTCSYLDSTAQESLDHPYFSSVLLSFVIWLTGAVAVMAMSILIGWLRSNWQQAVATVRDRHFSSCE